MDDLEDYRVWNDKTWSSNQGIIILRNRYAVINKIYYAKTQ